METEVIDAKKPVAKLKHHTDLTADPQIQAVAVRHENDKKSTDLAVRISDAEISEMITQYGEKLDLDLYTIADTFNISATGLRTILKNPKFKEQYEAAKLKRGERFVMSGYKTVQFPMQKAMNGEEIDMAMVQAAKNLANYSLHMGMCLNNQFNPNNGGDGNMQSLNVTVNTGVQLKI